MAGPVWHGLTHMAGPAWHGLTHMAGPVWHGRPVHAHVARRRRRSKNVCRVPSLLWVFTASFPDVGPVDHVGSVNHVDPFSFSQRRCQGKAPYIVPSLCVACFGLVSRASFCKHAYLRHHSDTPPKYMAFGQAVVGLYLAIFTRCACSRKLQSAFNSNERPSPFATQVN
eukprot:363590-Chlamydomonas_euryale.AAC.4